VTLAALLLALAALLLLAGREHVLLHVLQQEHYENARLRVWLDRGEDRRQLPASLALWVVCLAVAGIALASSGAGIAAAAVALVAAGLRLAGVWRRDQIKPLVFTKRAKRLFGLSLALPGVPLLALAAALPGEAAVVVAGALGGGLHAFGPGWLTAANVALRPVQRRETERFVRSARERLAAVAPLVVGITGSYGKTTTKACVAAVLDTAGPSYPTPASFNSHLGVVRAINEGLREDHQSFVVEMGAYREGDIAELCELVHPRIAILTAIGPAHLERFGSLDVTERAKGEIAEALPADGVFVTRADDERCRRVAATRTAARAVLFSPQPHPDADLWAEGLEVRNGRTQFALCRRVDGEVESTPVRAQLLGTHNVANLLAAAAVGFESGLTAKQVARALGRVKPPEHRLAPIVNQAAGIVVIDDSYNANPSGAAAALEVLRHHEAQRRILVTPGMVELGDEEEAENRELGRIAARSCDLCLLSGPRAAVIREGLLEAGFPDEHAIVLPDGPSAHRRLAELSRRGDVILFENDLPDVYA
jgi:UDP-N-acetylmuramoyl-tripeptide--D-alanyl-D-alanine ligase